MRTLDIQLGGDNQGEVSQESSPQGQAGSELLRPMKNAPSNHHTGDEEADGEDLKKSYCMHRKRKAKEHEPMSYVKVHESAPRESQISKEDVFEPGYPRACLGCSRLPRGLARQRNNELCRNGFEELLKKGARVKNAANQKDELEEKALRRTLEKEARRQLRRPGEVELEDGETRIRKSAAEVSKGEVEGKHHMSDDDLCPNNPRQPHRVTSLWGAAETVPTTKCFT